MDNFSFTDSIVRGFLISIEGMDTAGKSTQAKLLYEKLVSKGKKVKLIHFPNYSDCIGEYIGEILSNKEKFNAIDKEALQLLYVADQLNAQKNYIQKYLEEGYTVIVDRYDLSTIAYYAVTANLNLPCAINTVYHKYQIGFIRPDITYILNLPKEEVAKRKNVFDNMEKLNDIGKISDIYKEMPDYIFDHRYFVAIDATMSVEDVHKEIYRYIFGIEEIRKVMDECIKI